MSRDRPCFLATHLKEEYSFASLALIWSCSRPIRRRADVCTVGRVTFAPPPISDGCSATHEPRLQMILSRRSIQSSGSSICSRLSISINLSRSESMTAAFCETSVSGDVAHEISGGEFTGVVNTFSRSSGSLKSMVEPVTATNPETALANISKKSFFGFESCLQCKLSRAGRFDTWVRNAGHLTVRPSTHDVKVK